MALVVENPPANSTDIRDLGSILGLGRSPEGGHGNPFQYSCLEKPMDRAAWWPIVHGVLKCWTRLSKWTTKGLLGFPGGASGKELACQCRKHKRHGINPWIGKIPWMRAWQTTPVFLPGQFSWKEDPGSLQPVGSQSVGQNWGN